jgi:hypothetical protein
MATTRRTPLALLALGVAALLSSWNPASAPMAVAVGLLAAGLCLQAWREADAPPIALRAALAISVAAALVGGAVSVRAARAGRSGDERPLVDEVPRAERQKALDRAEESTRSAREAARKELEAADRGR